MFGYTFWSSLLQEFAEYEAAGDGNHLLYYNRYRKFCIGLGARFRSAEIVGSFYWRKRSLLRDVPWSRKALGKENVILSI